MSRKSTRNDIPWSDLLKHKTTAIDELHSLFFSGKPTEISCAIREAVGARPFPKIPTGGFGDIGCTNMGWPLELVGVNHGDAVPRNRMEELATYKRGQWPHPAPVAKGKSDTVNHLRRLMAVGTKGLPELFTMPDHLLGAMSESLNRLVVGSGDWSVKIVPPQSLEKIAIMGDYADGSSVKIMEVTSPNGTGEGIETIHIPMKMPLLDVEAIRESMKQPHRRVKIIQDLGETDE